MPDISARVYLKDIKSSSGSLAKNIDPKKRSLGEHGCSFPRQLKHIFIVNECSCASLGGRRDTYGRDGGVGGIWRDDLLLFRRNFLSIKRCPEQGQYAHLRGTRSRINKLLGEKRAISTRMFRRII